MTPTMRAKLALMAYGDKHRAALHYAVEFDGKHIYAANEKYKGKLYSMRVDTKAFCKKHKQQIIEALLLEKAGKRKPKIMSSDVRIAIAQTFDAKLEDLLPRIKDEIKKIHWK